MSAIQIVGVVISACGAVWSLVMAWKARQSVRRIEEGRPRPATRRELDRIARKRGL